MVGSEKVIRSSNELPPGWQKATLAEVAEIIMGQSPSSQYYNSDGEGLPFFQGKAEFGELYPKPVKWCSQPNKVAQKDDVLMSVRAPVGPTNLAISECCIGRGLAAIRPRDGVPSRYVLYYLRSIESGIDALGTGTTFKAISGGILRSIPIPVAPAAQQKRIVAEIEKQFSRLDEAVANLERVKANLKRYKAAVFKAAVEGKLTEDWRKQHPDVEPASKLLERILTQRQKSWQNKRKYKEPFELDTTAFPLLPKGWIWASLEAISDAIGGLAFESKKFTSTGFQVLKMANIRMGRIDVSQKPSFIQDVEADVVAKYGLMDGDLVVTLTGTRKKQDYGYVAVVRNAKELLLNQRIARLRPADGVLPQFLALALQSEDYRNRFFAYETGNVGQGNVGMGAVTKAPIMLAPFAEQQQIVAEVEHLLSVIEELEAVVEANLTRANRMRKAILRQAFSGALLRQRAARALRLRG